MSKEQLEAFIEKVKEDKDLQKKLAALPKDDTKAAQETTITIAKESGFDVNAEDLIHDRKEQLDDDELDAVAGGTQSSGTEMPRVITVDMWV